MAAEPKDDISKQPSWLTIIDRWIAAKRLLQCAIRCYSESFDGHANIRRWFRAPPFCSLPTIVGLLFASVFINEQRKIADNERDRANRAAIESDRQRTIADEALLASQKSNATSIEIIAQFVEKLADDGWANVPHKEAERISMVDAGVSRFKKLLDDNSKRY